MDRFLRPCSCLSHLLGVNVLDVTQTRTSIRMSLMRSVRAAVGCKILVSRSLDKYPHGCAQCNLKEGSHQYHTPLLDPVNFTNLGVGKSIRCLDHFLMPVANMFCLAATAQR